MRNDNNELIDGSTLVDSIDYENINIDIFAKLKFSTLDYLVLYALINVRILGYYSIKSILSLDSHDNALGIINTLSNKLTLNQIEKKIRLINGKRLGSCGRNNAFLQGELTKEINETFNSYSQALKSKPTQLSKKIRISLMGFQGQQDDIPYQLSTNAPYHGYGHIIEEGHCIEYQYLGQNVTLDLLITASQEEYASSHDQWIQNADIVIICVGLTTDNFAQRLIEHAIRVKNSLNARGNVILACTAYPSHSLGFDRNDSEHIQNLEEVLYLAKSYRLPLVFYNASQEGMKASVNGVIDAALKSYLSGKSETLVPAICGDFLPEGVVHDPGLVSSVNPQKKNTLKHSISDKISKRYKNNYNYEEYLVKRHAIINIAFVIATITGKIKILDYLLDAYGVLKNICAKWDTLLSIAVMLESYEMIAYLLKTSSRVNIQVNFSYPKHDNCLALFFAADEKDLGFVDLLVSHGINVNARNAWGANILFYLLRNNKIFDQHNTNIILHLLKSANIKLDEVDSEGMTALMYIAKIDHHGVLVKVTQAILQENHGSGYITDSHGACALHYAILSGAYETGLAIIADGCDMNKLYNLSVRFCNERFSIEGDYTFLDFVCRLIEITTNNDEIDINRLILSKFRALISSALTWNEEEAIIAKICDVAGVARPLQKTNWPTFFCKSPLYRLQCSLKCNQNEFIAIVDYLNDPLVSCNDRLMLTGKIVNSEIWKRLLHIQEIKPLSLTLLSFMRLVQNVYYKLNESNKLQVLLAP